MYCKPVICDMHPHCKLASKKKKKKLLKKEEEEEEDEDDEDEEEEDFTCFGQSTRLIQDLLQWQQ